ncbi:trans-2-enoyl-CoA reductase (NADPH) [Alloalcanivorax dieselolei B5]|uniref:enoyl-[acyl-carrier-protein] reductase n=1 Tax=Alcanivorax dieselolei (strain DSM 16502 / CGMCC 1.3690 / MCCC 1A00001 / B-5) TaxID=930169 RepID=K0CIK7_ALCDB|nr:zinc-binding dehydrogenase [Alloalcanivorax dieselolei]AFT71396.1 trans-2-enoyl-CoA reductase (NADPH) [Alloalcanivorax dieselolei B5]GGK08253.1 alcohol dehydrogenase [Alloalcanivorax dieselolei]
MRSAIHTQFGEPAEVLALGDSPVPQPGPGQVRIKTLLSPIHNHDLWTVRGSYGYKPDLPAIGGSEAVGIVDALGEGVSGISPGQRIAVASVHGTWAEYFLAPAAGLIPVPEVIADEAAAQLIAMPFSAISLLEFLDLESGDWMVQNTANGAVGKTVAMLAAARGVNVINLVRRDAGVDEMTALGISNVVSTAHEGWRHKVREIVGDAPIRAAVDSIGGEASAALLSLLGENGVLVSFGTMTGEAMQLPSGDVIFKQATVKGFWGAKVSANMAAETKARLIGELLRLVAAGELQLPAEATFDLAQVSDAVTASLAPGKTGKVLLKP